jgi:predicted metal-binding membrane protein
MSTAASQERALSPARDSAAWPVILLVTLAGACWAITVKRMHGMDMGPGTALGGLGWFVVVWITMMAAMMLPSLSPMAVAYARAAPRGQARSITRTFSFAAGYLLPWAAFGLLAYVLIDGVRSLEVGFLDWQRAGRYLAGGVIVAAALYELTPPKARSLQRCRDFRLLRRRAGLLGGLAMGVEQGWFCIGCSGAMMAALFALGVMSIPWMLLIAALVAAEKLLPRTALVTGATAAVLSVLGLAILIAPGQVPWLTIPMPM